MTDYQKKQLEQQLWNVANQLRGKMHADEFRDYCLGFIFFKYLSEIMHRHANDIMGDGRDYLSIDELSPDGLRDLEAIREDAIEQLVFSSSQASCSSLWLGGAKILTSSFSTTCQQYC